MSRRICLFLVAAFALAAPATSVAQSSSQAQYQGVAPETSAPVTGNGGAAGGGGSSGGSAAAGNGGSTEAGGTTSGASGNGGGGASAPSSSASSGASVQGVVAPDATNGTAPFSGGDFVWIVLALAGLTGLGLLLRRATRAPAGT